MREAAEAGVAVPGDQVMHTARVGGQRGPALSVVRYRVTAVIGHFAYLQDPRGVRRKVSTWALRNSPGWSVQPTIPGVLDSRQ